MGVRSSHSVDVDSKGSGTQLIFEKQLGLIPLGNFYATTKTLHAVTICTILHFIAIMGFSARLVIFIIIFRRKKSENLREFTQGKRSSVKIKGTITDMRLKLSMFLAHIRNLSRGYDKF